MRDREKRVSTETIANSPMVEFRNVRKVFIKDGRQVPALGPVSFSVARSEFVAILGASGCGKSTTLNMTAGLMRPTAGTVLFDGRVVRSVNRQVGYLTQKDSLLPWRTIAENVALPLEIQSVTGSERRDRIATLIEAVGLQGFERHYPSEISGGMRKRAGIARMLVAAPDVLLLDEPFAALDAQLRGNMHQQLLDIWQSDRKTVVFVTHDLGEAVKLADRIVVMTARPGRIKAVYDVPLPRPRDLRELEFAEVFIAAQRDLSRLMEAEDPERNAA